MTRDSNALWVPSPNFGFPQGAQGRLGYRPQWIILHGTGGGGSVEWLTNPQSQVSAHYVIKQDGKVYQLVDEDNVAWANGAPEEGCDFWWASTNPNLNTISIEHEKPDQTNQIPLTSAQAISSFQLVQRICERWSIPARGADIQGGITGHFSISPVSRARCPGTYPWTELWTFLKGEQTMLNLTDPIVSSYFVDGGNGAWKCKKNGVVLFGGVLDFYRSHGGPALFGLPLANELYLPQYPNTAIMVCERALIVYDPERRIDGPPIETPCYLLHIESGIGQQLLLQAAQEPLQGQIVALQNKIASALRALA